MAFKRPCLFNAHATAGQTVLVHWGAGNVGAYAVDYQTERFEDMIVAIATNRIHGIQATGVLAWLDDFLYLPEVLYVMILVWLIFSGPGRYSVDGLIGRFGLFNR